MYVSHLNDYIERLIVVMATVDGIAVKQIHNGRRDLWDPATSEQLNWDNTNDMFSGWFVTRIRSGQTELEGSTSFLERRPHTIRIVGWSQLNDPQTGNVITSGPIWVKMVEDVCSVIREDLIKDIPLNDGTCLGGISPIVVTDEHRSISLTANGDTDIIRCHYCEIELVAVERITWA